MKILLAMGLAAATLAACGSQHDAPPTAAIPTPTVRPSATAVPQPTATPTPELSVYTVQRGDTLSAIAARTHRAMSDIVKLNNIADPNKIMAGQKLLLPPEPTATASPSSSGGSAGSAQAAASGSKPPPP
ncbi:MAG: LysM peptidoglycan-binding domain-containing protein [Chloroflexota bacterium]|nr:LysM peptidoglycan-binding domain-containing protein [Chloroflexota bacterium]